MHGRKIAVIGLGYVGLPVAVAFARAGGVVGFDVKAERIAELSAGKDRTGEVAAADLADAKIAFTSDPADLAACDFFIVAVPTPVDDANSPDLSLVVAASRTVGRALKPGGIVVYESTVYPGATEEDCVPVLERESGLSFGRDFAVGYSPERINPGDREHTFTRIRKIVAASDPAALEVVASVYGSVVEAGVYKAGSIRVAEAAKVIENTQRDLNIALMNELALIFERMGIDTSEVLEAAGTKWNFLPFRPGLVGGHCIGVDPYYLTHQAEKIGYIPQVILAGRRINDSMGGFIAHKAVKLMARAGVDVARATVTVLGLTFKEDCPDVRNTRVFDLVRELRDYGIRVQVCDPVADAAEALHEHRIELVDFDRLAPADAVIVAVAHRQFRGLDAATLTRLLLRPDGVVCDVKAVLDRRALEQAGIALWRL